MHKGTKFASFPPVKLPQDMWISQFINFLQGSQLGKGILLLTESTVYRKLLFSGDDPTNGRTFGKRL